MLNKHNTINKIIQYEGTIDVHRLSNTIYRVGFCSRCGCCCRNIDILTRVSGNVIDWLSGYGIKITTKTPIFDRSSDGESEPIEFAAQLNIPITCNYLIQDETTQQHACTRYQNSPLICQGYPRSQSKYPTCTFVFLKEDEFEWFVTEYNKYWEAKNGTKKEIHFGT
jgi:Fe-S-cluster containining protein